MWHYSCPPSWTFVLRSHGLLFTFRRPLIRRIFGIQNLDHGCCLIPLSHFVSFTALAICPPRYVVTVITIAIRLVQPSLYLWSSSCCPTDHVTLSLSLHYLRRFHQEPTPPSSQSLKSSSRFYPVAVHLRRRPLHPRHESQHPSLTGVRPLERAYCHER
jgi:hypothetical protein